MMIGGKYKVVQTLKDTPTKSIHRCLRSDSSPCILKAYTQTEAKFAQNELSAYRKLTQPHLHGFPEVTQAFEENGRAYLVMEELGNNLEDLRQHCGGRLGLKTVVMVGLQLLERVEYLHGNGMLHGDIKPSNAMVGKHKLRHKIYLSDF